jgi:hypothetical protein
MNQTARIGRSGIKGSDTCLFHGWRCPVDGVGGFKHCAHFGNERLPQRDKITLYERRFVGIEAMERTSRPSSGLKPRIFRQEISPVICVSRKPQTRLSRLKLYRYCLAVRIEQSNPQVSGHQQPMGEGHRHRQAEGVAGSQPFCGGDGQTIGRMSTRAHDDGVH